MENKFGIENLKSFLNKFFGVLPVDRDGDGKVEVTEITSALFAVAPEILMNYGDISDEVSDFTAEELQLLLDHVVTQFPEKAAYNAETERIVVLVASAAKSTAGAVADILRAVKAFKKPELAPEPETANENDLNAE